MPDWERCTKVRNHCQLTGKYRGAANVIYKLKTRDLSSKMLPIALHNLNFYDAPLLNPKLIKRKYISFKFGLVPETIEKYLSITDGSIKFIDSYSFIFKRLEAMAKTLKDENTTMKINVSADQWGVGQHKIIYPYEPFKNISDHDKPLAVLKKISIVFEQAKLQIRKVQTKSIRSSNLTL